MQDRYGFNKSHGIRNTLVIGVISLFVAILAFVTVSLAQNNIEFRLISWNDFPPDRVDITFEVRRPADVAVVCVIRAQDRNRIDLGYQEVLIASGTGFEQVTYSLRTLAPAFTAELLTCVAQGEPTRVPGPQFPAGVAPPEQPWSDK
jgi:hypothetical protein